MNDELNAISVGLSVGLGSLDRDIAKIQKQVASVEGDHVINFNVGKVNTAEVQAQLKKLTQNALPVMLNVTVARGSAAGLRRELLAQLRSSGPVPIQIKANLSVTEVHRIRSEISQRLGQVGVTIRPGGGGVGGAGGTPSPSGPITSHERRVNDDAATKVGRAIRGTAAQPGVAHAAPTPPSPASAPTAAVPVAQRASTGGAARSTRAVVPSAAVAAPSFINADDIARPTGGSLAARLRKKAEKAFGRRVSPDELRAQSRRVAQPETPEEIEYAARPTVVSDHEKPGRGVRGASRSGARERNEPVLLPSDYTARDIQHDDAEAENAAQRSAAVRAPARKSAAYFGSRRPGAAINPILDKLQFYRFSPVLGDAFTQLQAGNTDAARKTLRGFSASLSTADPRERKKFFRLFRNVENVPPELLEKDAALRSLFAEIHSRTDPSFTNVASGNTLSGAGGGAGKKAPSVRNTIDKDLRALNDGTMSREEFDVRHQTLKRRAGGGPVSGNPNDPYRDRGDSFDWLRRKMRNRRPALFDAGPEDEAPTGRVAKLRAMADQSVSPNESEIARRMLHEKGIRGYAGGGPVKGGLMARLAQQKMRDAYLVGEHKPETYVDKHGNAEIVGEHGPEIRTFPEDGKIEPFVPVWLRNLKAKDLTHRAAGGPVRAFGGARFRSFVSGEKEAIAGGLLGRSDSGSVQRVFVVNFPAGAGAFASNPRGAGIAAGPLRFGSDKDATKFAQELGGHIGGQLKDLLGNTAVATPAKAEKETPIAPPGAFERQQARQRARGTAAGIEATISSARSQTAEAQQVIPVRSLSVAVGQIFSTIFGGRGDAITRAKQANELAAKATSAASNFKSEQQKLLQVTGQLRKAENPKQQAELIEKVKDQAKATRAARNEAESLAGQAKAASEQIVSSGGALRNLGAGTVGVVAGTLGFGAALGVAQLGLQAVTAVAQPAIDRLTGFVGTSDAVTSALGDQIKAQNGATQSAFAMTAANAGLSKSTADLIGPLVAQRASIEEGNKQLGLGLDLLHSFEDARRRGGEQGLFSTTGGLLGTSIGGTASTQEIIKKELNAPEATATGIGGLGSGGYDPKIVAAAKAAQAAGNEGFVNPITGQMAKTVDVLAKANDQQSILSDRIHAFNSDIVKGGQKMQFLAGASDDAAKSFASLADRAGFTEIGDVARGPNKVILVGPDGKTPINTEADLKAAVVALNAGQNAPDPALLIKQLTERIIPAQKAQFRAEGNFQRGILNPAQFALGQLAAPTPGTKGGPAFESGIVGTDPLTGKIDKAAAASAAKYKSLVGGAVTFVNDQIDKGREALINLVPPDVRQQFSGLLDDITKTGKQIVGIQTGLQQQQVNLDVAEYNNQLRIARRSLSDAKDLQQGIAGATKDTLGGLEGQNVALNRQLQLLQFELQQRQINFKLATAGFVAPGTTPEERAARISEAKIEASFAQKQLDIQKQLANNQFKGVKISAGRDVTDLVRQIGLLEQGRTLTLNAAAANRTLDILNKKEQTLVQQAGTYIEEGAKITSAALQAAAQVEEQTGKDFKYILGETATAWGIFGSQAQVILNALTGTAPTSGSGQTQKQKGGKYAAANGIVGDTLGTTELTVGEAAGEKVAVLKNPKLVPTSTLGVQGGGFGGGSAAPVAITVIVTGNKIDDSLDEHALAERIATKVEAQLMRKTSLFGLRRI